MEIPLVMDSRPLGLNCPKSVPVCFSINLKIYAARTIRTSTQTNRKGVRTEGIGFDGGMFFYANNFSWAIITKALFPAG